MTLRQFTLLEQQLHALQLLFTLQFIIAYCCLITMFLLIDWDPVPTQMYHHNVCSMMKEVARAISGIKLSLFYFIVQQNVQLYQSSK